MYANPINSDPSDSALKLTEPAGFVKEISDRLGLFYTAGFQEDHKALANNVFPEEEFRIQATLVLAGLLLHRFGRFCVNHEAIG